MSEERTVKQMLRSAAKNPRETRQKWGCTSCEYIHPTDTMEWAAIIWNDGMSGMCHSCVAMYRSTKTPKGRPPKK